MMPVSPRRRRWLFWSYTALLLTLTHIPPAQIGRIPLHLWDKSEHLMAYAGMALLALWSMPAWPRAGTWIALFSRRACPPMDGEVWPRAAARMAMIAPLAFMTLLGAIDEWTQPFFGRACELNDWIADSLGVLTAAILVWLWRRSKRRARHTIEVDEHPIGSSRRSS